MISGTILINGTYIGEWEAVRQQHPPQEINDYKVMVRYRDKTGHLHVREGTLSHRYVNGALSLAANILNWAAKAVETPAPLLENAEKPAPDFLTPPEERQ